MKTEYSEYSDDNDDDNIEPIQFNSMQIIDDINKINLLLCEKDMMEIIKSYIMKYEDLMIIEDYKIYANENNVDYNNISELFDLCNRDKYDYEKENVDVFIETECWKVHEGYCNNLILISDISERGYARCDCGFYSFVWYDYDEMNKINYKDNDKFTIYTIINDNNYTEFGESVTN